jgi:SAM-dependent methyltransferase
VQAVTRRSRIHEGLVGERLLVGTPYLADPELRAQYDDQIAPRTEAALARIFAEGAWPGVRRALDLGAGTGAAGRALRARFGTATEVVAVDRVAGPGVDVVADLRRPAPVATGRFDLIVAAHMLGELALAPAARAELVLSWRRAHLGEGGRLVLLEPALRETSRGLLAVRDHLCRAGLVVLAPCLRQDGCPALLRERDFCHASADWEAQRRGRSRVDFTYLVLADREAFPRDDGAAPGDAPSGQFRIVSDPIVDKGRLRLWGCGAPGRLELVRLKRHRSSANAAFDDLGRGDVATFAPATIAGDRLEVGEATRVSRSGPSASDPQGR